jgi:hypothetical protein
MVSFLDQHEGRNTFELNRLIMLSKAKGPFPMFDYDRMVQTALREFERKIRSEVDRKFAEVLMAMQAGIVCKVPIIGGEWPPEDYPEVRAELKPRAIRALCCRKWFEFEAPMWAQPLPLTDDDCVALFNQPNERLHVVGEYGILLRSSGWHRENVRPFEKYCGAYYRL